MKYFEEIVAIVVKQTKLPKELLKADSNLTELGVTSLDLVLIFMEIEKRHSVKMNDLLQVAEFDSIQVIDQYISENK